VLASASFASNPSLDSIVAKVISLSCSDFPYHPYQNYWKIKTRKNWAHIESKLGLLAKEAEAHALS
jgi:hypothetical protein